MAGTVSVADDVFQAAVDDMDHRDPRFNPYARRHHDGAEELAMTSSTHLRRELEKKGDTHAEVYDWRITKLPKSNVLPMSEVRNILLSLYSDARDSYATEGRERWEEDDHRRLLVEENGVYDAFTKTHPRLFLMMTAREVPASSRQHVLNMVSLKQQHLDSGMPMEAQQKEISTYFQQSFTHKTVPGEREDAIDGGYGYDADAVKLPAPDAYQPGGAMHAEE